MVEIIFKITSPDVIPSSEMQIHHLRIHINLARFLLDISLRDFFSGSFRPVENFLNGREIFLSVENFSTARKFFYRSRISFVGREFFTGRKVFGRSRVFVVVERFFGLSRGWTIIFCG